MLLLAAAALAASSQPAAPVRTASPAVQVRATVRIVSGVRLRLTGEASADAPPPRVTTVRADRPGQPAKLIEFE